ncbi:MAG: hypothetical protein OEZ04_05465 [Nitrospinota bacterium]|nr:hypothetical protein [Nitrospinota bacterium]
MNKKIVYMSARALLTVLFITGSSLMVSCSGSEGGGEPSSGGGNCGPAHTMETFFLDWEYIECPKTDTIIVDQQKVGTGGAALGDREVSWGMLSVTYHGLLNANIPSNAAYGVFFKAHGLGMNEANWHFIAHNVEDNIISTRLILQRFDGVCQPFCEEMFSTYDLQFEDENEAVQFDCAWSVSEIIPDGKIWCTVTKMNSNQTHEYWTVMKGLFVSLDYAGVGKKSFQGVYPGFPAQVSDFKFTIFQ